MTKTTSIHLEDEARRLHPVLEKFYSRFLAKQISGVDFAAAFILMYFALRRPKSWSNGKLKERIHPSNHIESTLTLREVEEDFLRLLDQDYLAKKLQLTATAVLDLSLIDLFNQLQFLGIKHNSDHYINRCVVMWALGQRPVRLLHHIPTPTEVLGQQAAGERVVTLFTTVEELSRAHTSKLTYMTGMQEHSRDPLEFLLHDLKHMENFRDEHIYLEQVGFFRCMLNLHQGKVKTFFTKILGYDINLWYELEYVISDMNCYSTHLLRYLFAKLYLACVKRVTAGLSETGDEVKHSLEMDAISLTTLKAAITEHWIEILAGFGMQPACTHELCPEGRCLSQLAYRAALDLVEVFMKEREDLSETEWNDIRDFFKAVGADVVNKAL